MGSVDAGSGQLTRIIDAVLGWETITNPAAAIPGRSVESDEVSRNRRRRTLALQGRSVPEAIRSNITDVPGVRSLAFRENTTSATRTIDGIELVAHSIWVAVDGGADSAIAAALLRSKTVGADWNGSQSVAVTEPVSGQNYTVKFDRPTETAMALRIRVRRTSAVSDPITTARRSALRYARGEIPGEQGFSIGFDVSPFEIASAINRDTPEIFVERLEVAQAAQNPSYSTNTFTIATNGLATLVESNIQVVIV